MGVIVYDHPLSPYSQKVKIALLEKRVPFEAPLPRNIGSGGAGGEFVAANPRAEVPALIDGDVKLFDSTIILDYIDERWPEPSLLPALPAARARMRMIEEVMDTHYEAITWGLAEIAFFGRASGALAEQLNARAREQLARWHEWLDAKLGTASWFGGDRFGRADLCVIPFLNGAASFGIVPKPGSGLAAWAQRSNARDSVAQVTSAARSMAMGGSQEATAGMSAVKKLLDQGLFKREYRDHRLEWMVKSGGLSVVSEGLAKSNIRFTDEFSA